MSQSPRETLQQEFEHLLKAEKACFDGIRNWSHGPAPKELNGLPELRQQFDPKLLRLQEHFVGKQTLLTYVNELRSLLIPVRNAVLFADKSFRDYVADPFNSRGFHSKLRAHLGWKLRDGLRPLNQDLLDTHQQSLERAMEQCRALFQRILEKLDDFQFLVPPIPTALSGKLSTMQTMIVTTILSRGGAMRIRELEETKGCFRASPPGNEAVAKAFSRIQDVMVTHVHVWHLNFTTPIDNVNAIVSITWP